MRSIDLPSMKAAIELSRPPDAQHPLFPIEYMARTSGGCDRLGEVKHRLEVLIAIMEEGDLASVREIMKHLVDTKEPLDGVVNRVSGTFGSDVDCAGGGPSSVMVVKYRTSSL